MYWR